MERARGEERTEHMWPESKAACGNGEGTTEGVGEGKHEHSKLVCVCINMP